MSTLHSAASSLSNFDDTISTISSLVPRPLPDFISQPWCEIKSGSGLGTRLDDLYDSTLHLAVLIRTRTNVCRGITAHTLWRSHGEHQVNTKSFLVLFTCRVRCHVHAASRFGGRGQFLSLIIKRILGIRRTFPCSF